MGRAGPVNTYKRIKPARLKFEEPLSFKAEKFLADRLSRAGLRDPAFSEKLKLTGPDLGLLVCKLAVISSSRSPGSGTQ